MRTIEAQVIGPPRDELGEGPVWCPREQALYWIDGLGRKIHRRDAAGAVRSWPLSKMPGSFALREGGGALIAMRNGLATFDFGTGVETPLDSGVDHAVERFNDGKCDRRGRFWVGSMDKGLVEPVGAIYRVDPDRRVTRVFPGIVLGNRFAWSPDDRTMYHVDSRPGRVFAYDFDPERGAVSNRRLFLDYAGQPHGPDGCTVDAEGFLWVTEVRAGRVVRYSPDAKPERTVTVPVARPTSVTFGDADLGTLYITSMRMGVAPEELARNPLHGGVFAARPGVTGLPEPRFAG
ncbi:MAG TPA: SMP-30/gluconolactonase/LRE family protein [Burkholderiaceae bacterium]|nr:SMP-30/gluconolactonase/LRE family protein [Burkholderiaceae bacterium]